MKIALLFNLKRNNCISEQEFDLPETIDVLGKALALRHEVRSIECHTHIAEWLRELVSFQPELLFSVAEGYHGAAREAFYPALYEQLQIPYCNSDPTTVLITHNKALTKRIVDAVGVTTAWSVAISCERELRLLHEQGMFSYPLLVKPNSEGSSLGIDENAIVHTIDALALRIHFIWDNFRTIALVERYIPRGMDVSMTYVEGLGEEFFGPVEYRYPHGEIFDFAAKTRYYARSILEVPEQSRHPIEQQLKQMMKLAVKALGVKGYARADFRIDPQNICYFLEMNAQAEMRQERSDFMAPLFQEGYTYEEIILHIVEYAASHPRLLPSMAGLYYAGSGSWGTNDILCHLVNG